MTTTNMNFVENLPKKITKKEVSTSVPVIDRLIASALIIIFLPAWVFNISFALLCGKRVIGSKTFTDACAKELILHKFTIGIFKRSLNLTSIIRGDLAFVGSPIFYRTSVNNTAEISGRSYCSLQLSPGLFSLWGIRKNIGINEHSLKESIEIQKRDFSSPLSQVKILLKSMLSYVLYSHKETQVAKTIRIFGININNLTMQDAVSQITQQGRDNTTNIGYFVNVNSFNIAATTEGFRETINQAKWVFADGSGVRLAASQAGFGLKANVNGTDMLPLLCESLAKKNKSIYLLGAAPGVAQATANNLKKRFPGLSIAGVQHGFFNSHMTEKVIEDINASGCHLLLVAMGSPIQEAWLAKHKSQLKVPCALAVGGLFDFFSGNIPRAPMWLRELGFEWVWRLLQEPTRMWKRYLLGNPLFLFRTYFRYEELTK